MALDADKLKPQFADGWYEQPSPSQMRQELQHVYERLKDINAEFGNIDLTSVDAELLDGQDGTWYLDRANHTGTQLHTTISDFDAGVQANRLDQLATPTASVGLGSQKIVSLADPTNPQDAATKAYVDSSSDADTLDTLDSTQFLRSDVDDTASGTITFTDTAPLKFDYTNVRATLWEILDSGASNYGFYLDYRGDLTGNDNRLELYGHNQAGTDVKAWQVTQDGKTAFTQQMRVSGLTTTIGANPTAANIAANAHFYVESGSDRIGFDPNEISATGDIVISTGGVVEFRSRVTGNLGRNSTAISTGSHWVPPSGIYTWAPDPLNSNFRLQISEGGVWWDAGFRGGSFVTDGTYVRIRNDSGSTLRARWIRLGG